MTLWVLLGLGLAFLYRRRLRLYAWSYRRPGVHGLGMEAKLVRVIDGDTFTVAIDGLHKILGEDLPVRIAGIDAPEMNAPGGSGSRLALMEILHKARRIDLLDVKRGKYFRLVSRVLADGEDVGERMKEERHAVPYFGGSRR